VHELEPKLIINDGDAECLFCTELFWHDKYGEKWAQCEVDEVYVVCSMCRESV